MVTRTPESPTALVDCIRKLFADHPELEQRHRVDAFVDAGEVLQRLDRIEQGGDGRGRGGVGALDLLAADACVTYAFEAAADEPATLGARAELAKITIANVAAGIA